MSTSGTIRVLLIDDHELILRGIAATINRQGDMLLSGTAQSVEEAYAICSEQHPDVAIVGQNLCKPNITDTINTVRRIFIASEIILLTTEPNNPQLLQQLLGAGAIGCIPYNISAANMFDAIRKAADGNPSISSNSARTLMDALIDPEPIGKSLTTREQHVLSCMIDGLNNRQIAEQLEISRHTVKEYVSNILSKLGVSNRVEAVRVAIERDLVN